MGEGGKRHTQEGDRLEDDEGGWEEACLAEKLGGEIDAEDDAVDEGYGTEDHGGGGMLIAGLLVYEARF